VTFDLIRDMDRDDLVAEGFVSHEAATGNEGHEAAERRHRHDGTRTAGGKWCTVTHTTDEIEAPPVHLGNYDDTPLDVHAGVVTPAAEAVLHEAEEALKSGYEAKLNQELKILR
jgi:hypothetical protein